MKFKTAATVPLVSKELYSEYATGWTPEVPWFDYSQRQDMYLISKLS